MSINLFFIHREWDLYVKFGFIGDFKRKDKEDIRTKASLWREVAFALKFIASL